LSSRTRQAPIGHEIEAFLSSGGRRFDAASAPCPFAKLPLTGYTPHMRAVFAMNVLLLTPTASGGPARDVVLL
jgi:hypothetical protein